MKQFKIYYLLFSIYCLTLLSCQKETEDSFTDESVTTHKTQATNFTYEQMKVENGMLYFEDKKTLDNFIAFTYKIENRESWFETLEKRRNFVSLRQHYYNMLDKINEMEDEETLLKYVDNNDKYWYIDETDPENQELMQRYDYGKYYFLANQNLHFKVGSRIWDLSKISQVKPQMVSYQNQKMTCNQEAFEASATKDERWCKNDRRVVIKMNTGAGDFGTEVDAGYDLLVRGKRRRACIWANYKTTLQWRNVSGRIEPKLNGGAAVIPAALTITTPNRSESGDEYNISTRSFATFAKPNGNSNSVVAFPFISLHGEATSRGLGHSIWATANCN